MMPVRLCFENKNILSISYTKEKNCSKFEFWFFPPYFDGTLFTFIMQINIAFWRFKENLA